MADNRISASKREIYPKLIDVMEKYEPNLANVDYAKTGFVGWAFETNAMMLRDSTYHKSVIYNEHFLNTAQIPQTVYNYAKMYNVEIDKATPAYADANIYIGEAELDNLLDVGGSIVLNREDQIIAGEYEFALEHSIVINKVTIASNNGLESINRYTAKYEDSDGYVSTNYQNLTSPVLQVRQDGENVIIPVRLYQYRINKYNTQIVSSTFLNKKQTFKFEDQFCGAKLFYVKNNKKINIPLVYSELDTTETNYAMYNLTDTDELEIIFKEGDNYFTPAPNSNIIVYIYTTKGEDVPKSFSGNALMKISNTDLKTLPVIIQFDPIDIIGGVNTASLEKLKQKIINEISISHTIVTQADLDDYFNKIITIINEINDGRIKFIKRRDDIIKRVFDSYLLLRDRTDESVSSMKIKTDNKYISPCIPTNSINVTIPLGNATNSDGTLYNVSGRFKQISQLNDTAEYQLVSDDTSSDYYVCPFKIYFYNGDYQFVKYVFDITNSKSELKTKNISDVANANVTTSFNSRTDNINTYYMTPVSAELNRGFAVSNSFNSDSNYFLYLNFVSNFAVGETENSLNKKSSAKIKINGLRAKADFNVEDIYTTKVSDGIYNLTIEIRLDASDDKFQNGDFNSITVASADGSVEFLDSESLSFELVPADLFVDAVSGNSVYPTLQVTNPLKFFSSLDNIMSSEVTVVNQNTIKINRLPVIHGSFFSDKNANLDEKKKGFTQQLFKYIEKLQESSELLETSTNFNLKFYNTYGPSYLYETPTTNLKIDMRIVLNDEYKNNAELQGEIKSYIRRLVDMMNTNLGYIDIYKVIAILYDTEVYGNYIKNISYAAGSDSLLATIPKVDLESEYPNLNYTENDFVPEWLNLDYDYLINNTEKNSGIIFI